MKKRRIRLGIEARLENAALAGAAARGVANLAGFSGLTAKKIETCMVEAVNNTILHAYGQDPEQSVEILLETSTKGILISVMDRGKSMGELPDGKLDFDPDDTGSLPESGMGLCIIRGIMDRVEYVSRKEGNILKMFKRL